MKTQEYVKKYRLDQGEYFNRKLFISDLTMDFMTLLEVGKGNERLKGFENAVHAIRMKWDGISNRIPGQLPERLWNFFYATVICKMREELFPEILAQRKAEYKERQRIREERRKINESWQDNEQEFWNKFFFRSFLLNIFDRLTRPIASFEKLGLNINNCTEQDVKTVYRSMVMIHHPDKGGNSKEFQEITEAKNRCLIYLHKT